VTTNSPEFAADATVIVGDVSKWFGEEVAVSNVSCSFGPGVSGLLGPNGAGKTTLLRMLAGLLRPSEGSVSILGENPVRHTDVYRQVGLVPEESAVYTYMNGREFVHYSAKLSSVPDPGRATQRALEQVDLVDDASRPVGTYSKGMRQRIKVAAALVLEPQILILDEPLNGTDPVQRARLIELFQELAAAGHTVIVSSHVLAEVERLADRVIAMVDGRLAAAGDVAAIRAAMSDIPFQVTVESDGSRRLGAALLDRPSVNGVTVAGDVLHVETSDLNDLGHQLLPLACDLDVRLTRFEPEDESLESVFRYLVHKR
jgi:ABC-2 type transport system ATP-binding protein